MQREGPPLEQLTRRLAEAPADFLASPRLGPQTGAVEVAAVVQDLLLGLGCPAEPAQLVAFVGRGGRDRNRLAIALLLCWLLRDEWVQDARPGRDALLALLEQAAAELAPLASSAAFVSDPERREELARLALGRLGYRPAGESSQQAQDRLSSISSAERQRVLAASRAAEQRAAAIREALRRKAAEESADKWTRE